MKLEIDTKSGTSICTLLFQYSFAIEASVRHRRSRPINEGNLRETRHLYLANYLPISQIYSYIYMVSSWFYCTYRCHCRDHLIASPTKNSTWGGIVSHYIPHSKVSHRLPSIILHSICIDSSYFQAETYIHRHTQREHVCVLKIHFFYIHLARYSTRIHIWTIDVIMIDMYMLFYYNLLIFVSFSHASQHNFPQLNSHCHSFDY